MSCECSPRSQAERYTDSEQSWRWHDRSFLAAAFVAHDRAVARVFAYFIGNLLTYEFQLLLRRPTANQASEREEGTDGNVLVVHQVLFRQRQRVHDRVGFVNGLHVKKKNHSSAVAP